MCNNASGIGSGWIGRLFRLACTYDNSALGEGSMEQNEIVVLQRPTTITDALVDDLRVEILTGRLAPGEHLHQSQLAARYGVSRIPLRDALARLHSDGLVSIDQRRNTRVAKLDANDVREIYDIRLALEPMAARRAVELIDDAQALHLVQLCETMDHHAHDPLLGQRSRRAFYDEFYQLSGSPRIHAVIMRMRDEVTRYHLTARNESEHAHATLRRCIIERDADEVERMTEKHLSQARDDLIVNLTTS